MFAYPLHSSTFPFGTGQSSFGFDLCFFYWSDLREKILVTTYIPNLPKKIYAPTDPLEMAL
jgi:hypothetical protein